MARRVRSVSNNGADVSILRCMQSGNDVMTQIDLDQLNLMTGGDVGLALEVLTIFRSQTDLWGPLLDPQADNQQWADACHTIKGAARSIGAQELGMACEKAEKRGREGGVSPVEASVLLSAVKDELGNAMEALASVEHQLSGQNTFRAKA
tara:strand:+ start:590 stop:1039 length:450 start_codon:yes stop_codon:yes gene_type:complete